LDNRAYFTYDPIARTLAERTLWNEHTVSALMHLMACFKAGRWDELISQVLTGKFETPSFQPKSSPKSSSPIPPRKGPMTVYSCADDYQELSKESVG
jgi:hypothetical protein